MGLADAHGDRGVVGSVDAEIVEVLLEPVAGELRAIGGVLEHEPDGGVADPERTAFLRDHLVAAHKAIQEGVRLESYHVWSLLDNFEWAEGYSQRWGIVHVDFASQRRILKDSAKWYRGVIAANRVG